MKVLVIKVMTILRFVFMTVMCQGWFRIIFAIIGAYSVEQNGIFKNRNYACGKATDSVQLISFLDDTFC